MAKKVPKSYTESLKKAYKAPPKSPGKVVVGRKKKKNGLKKKKAGSNT